MYDWIALDYDGGAFKLFGSAHVGTLVVLALMTVAWVYAGRSADADSRRRQRRVLAIILLVNEMGWHVWNLAYGTWTVKEMLPFHVCSIMVWITVAVLWSGYVPLYASVYFLGIAGAAQALITPDAGLYGFPHFRYFQTMIAHGGLVAAGIWLVTAERYRPRVRDGIRVLAALNVYALAMYFVNGWIGSNYLYVNSKPDTASLLDAMPAWPWYVPILEVLAVIFFWLLILPFAGRPEVDPRPEVAPTMRG